MGLNLFFEKKKILWLPQKSKEFHLLKKGPSVFEVKPVVVVAVGGVVEVY